MFSFTLAKVFITLILGKYEDTNYHFILEAASLSIRGSVIKSSKKELKKYNKTFPGPM